jgi:hypothetical protein
VYGTSYKDDDQIGGEHCGLDISGNHLPLDKNPHGCSTLSTEFPLEERIGSGESGGVSILTEC